MRILLLSIYFMLLPFPYIYSHNPAAYEVPKDNTIANLAAEYEGSVPVQEFASDEACEAAYKKFIDCADASSNGKTKELNEAYEEAWDKAEAACRNEDDAADKACYPEDDTPSFTSVQEFAVDEAACEAADKKFNDCADASRKTFGVKEKDEAANAAYEKEATGACKTEYDAYVTACPEDDDQGEDDQGDSPQM
jgi:hypothetical protein